MSHPLCDRLEPVYAVSMRKSAPVRFGSVRVRLPHAEAGQRIGLVGGSFNPPHAAHLLISRMALRRLDLDRVWWIVTPGNPLKSHDGLAPLEERLAKCRAIARDARITVTAFERDLGKHYTAGSLAYLRRRHARVRFVWIMGADCLAEFHRWWQWREIFASMPVAVVDRPGRHLPSLSAPAARAFARSRLPEQSARCLSMAHPPCWTMLTGPLSPLSSTAIRASQRENKFAR